MLNVMGKRNSVNSTYSAAKYLDLSASSSTDFDYHAEDTGLSLNKFRFTLQVWNQFY